MLFLTAGMHGMAYQAEMTVTKVEHGIVTFDDLYSIPEHEAWRTGDRALAIMLTRGTEDKSDDEIAHAEYVWRK
jgi:hypothetical protein